MSQDNPDEPTDRRVLPNRRIAERRLRTLEVRAIEAQFARTAYKAEIANLKAELAELKRSCVAQLAEAYENGFNAGIIRGRGYE